MASGTRPVGQVSHLPAFEKEAELFRGPAYSTIAKLSIGENEKLFYYLRL